MPARLSRSGRDIRVVGLVASMLIEVSPVFDGYYPDMVVDLIGAGYDEFVMPPKRYPPTQIRSLADFPPLTGTVGEIRRTVAGWHQEDVLFVRRDR